MNLPRKPRVGQKALQSLYNSICQIIDYLPSLTIQNTDGNIQVNHSPFGTVLNTKKNFSTGKSYDPNNQLYIFGNGLTSYIDWRVVSATNVPVEQMTKVIGLNISGDNRYISAYQVTDETLSGDLYGGWRIEYIGPTPSGGGSGGGGFEYTSLTPSLLAVNNTNHTLSAATQSGGGGSGMPWPNWANLGGSGSVVWPQTEYTTSTGGWLRISDKDSSNGCVGGVQINGLFIGLGSGPDTWPLAIPPSSTFRILMPAATFFLNASEDVMCWFDSNCSPGKTTTELIKFWQYGDENTSQVRSDIANGDSYKEAIPNAVRGVASVVEDMQEDWAEYQAVSGEPDYDPYEYYYPASVDTYRDWKNSITGTVSSFDTVYDQVVGYYTDAIDINDTMGEQQSDLVDYYANRRLEKIGVSYDEIHALELSAIALCNQAEAFWQAYDPQNYQPEETEEGG